MTNRSGIYHREAEQSGGSRLQPKSNRSRWPAVMEADCLSFALIDVKRRAKASFWPFGDLPLVASFSVTRIALSEGGRCLEEGHIFERQSL
jgi:hypothetical protein